MEVKESKEIATNLKFGLTVALSLGGALYTYHRIKNIKVPPGHGRNVDSRNENGEIKNDDRALENGTHRRVLSQNSVSDVSSSSRRSVERERECFLLPEYNDDDLCPKKCADEEEHEREIRRLRNRVKILEEKERNLELQLLEYYGIKEQETAVIELQNRLRLNTMEAKLYNLKIESLLLDNRRLEAQAADHANASAELEAAKGKIKMLRKKLKSEADKNKEQIMKLQEKQSAEVDQELKLQLEEACELKLELEEMKKCNEILKLENIELAQKLEYVQMLAENAVDNEEVQELKEESRHLKQENKEWKEEIDRLKAEKSTDVEELIFLRWINACLRNELKNYQPAGKTMARNLSPKSEEKVKKLLLEYASKEAKTIDSNYLESDQWSSSQNSCMTDERDELHMDLPSGNKASKPKLFGKLRRLLLGKSSRGGRQTPSMDRAQSGDNLPGRLSCEYPAGSPRVVDSGGNDMIKTSRILSRSASRRSFDVPRSYSRGSMTATGGAQRRSNVDDPSSLINRIEALADYESTTWSSAAVQGDQSASKEELLKFSEAFKDSGSKYSFRSSYESTS
ncbi:protein CHUP1, chloroplastic-like [Salvia miltiorrhiza]|uniref:protein CHUP1, chloroplastic-like n=1 Tax=Salvia miltiorrhiza TaxID=226208 RepID=UPI0025ACACA1|nr:protein CHUP1, chloroplastic-like [Salvia miltiorrhiza]